MEPVENKDQKEKTLKILLLEFAYELGLSIVIPLAILVFIGITIDKKFETSPFGVITGLIISLIFTSMAVAKKVKKFNP